MKKLLATLSILAVTACSSTSELGSSGTSFDVSGYSYNQVWDATLKGTQIAAGDQSLEVEKKLTINRQDKEAGVIEASTGLSLLSWGEIVGVYITPPKNAATHNINVDSLAKMKTNVFANNWEEEIIEAIKIELDKNKK